MKEKNPKLLKLFCLIVMLNLLFTSCEKDLYEQPTDTSFSTEEAELWYYSMFKKTDQYNKSVKRKDKKYPDWNNEYYRKIGYVEIIEFPLIKAKKQVSFVNSGKLNSAQAQRVLDASLTRAVFIKMGKDKIYLREIQYIPDYDYLERKGFDISDVDLRKGNDFSGKVIIKTWDSEVLSMKILSNGKTINTIKPEDKKKVKIKTSKSTLTHKTNGCETVTDQYWEAQCEIEQQGDVWVYTGECDNWVLVWESAPYEICAPDGTNPCDNNPDPNCLCEFYGFGCSDGGDGGGSPVVPAIIINDQALKNNPCLNEVYSKLGQASGFDYYLKRFDGNNSVANLNFAIGTLVGNTYGETSPPNNGSITITLDAGKLAETPPLFVADIFIHEIIHAEMFRKMMIAAESGNIDPTIMTTQQQIDYVESLRNNFPGLYDYYMRYEYNVPSGQEPSNAMHELMAQHYISIIVSALKQYDNTQTNDVYNAIAWCGLKGTGSSFDSTGLLPNSTTAWKNLSAQERLNLIQTLNNYIQNSPKCQN